MATLCNESKGYDEELEFNKDAPGDPNYCAWVVMAFPKGDWSRFKTWLVDFEAYAKRLSFDLDYYRTVTKDIENGKP